MKRKTLSKLPRRSRILAAVLAGFATAQRPWRAWPYKYPNIVQVQRVVGVLDAVADGETPIFPNKAADIHTFAVSVWAFMAKDSLVSGDGATVISMLTLLGITPSPQDETDKADWLEATWEVVRDPDRFLDKVLRSAWGYLCRALWWEREARRYPHSPEIPVAGDNPLWAKMPDPEPCPEERVLDQEEIRERIRARVQVIQDLLAGKLPPRQRKLLLLLFIGLEPVEAIREAGFPIRNGWVVYQSVRRKLQRRIAQE